MNLTKLRIKRIVPNENWQLVIEFHGLYGLEYRLLDCKILHDQKGWEKIAFPQHYKALSVLENEVVWDSCGKVTILFLYENSIHTEKSEINNHYIRLGFKNRAPTKSHNTHHVYGVSFAPYCNKPIITIQSIGGGIAAEEVGKDWSFDDLLKFDNWKSDFELAGCSWAITIIENKRHDHESLITSLVDEACKRNGT